MDVRAFEGQGSYQNFPDPGLANHGVAFWGGNLNFAEGEVALRSEFRVHTTAKPGNSGLNQHWHGTLSGCVATAQCGAGGMPPNCRKGA
jgi:hypothetical protein